MIGPAASVASAEGVGVLGCRVGWLPVGLDGSLLQIGVAWLQIGLSSGKAGGLLLPAISAGLIHENQLTVCKGTAFSWNKYQKQEENIILQSFCDLGRQGRHSE